MRERNLPLNTELPHEKPQDEGLLGPATCEAIPHADLLDMLKGAAWYSGGRECYGEHQGYSFDVDEETSLRDVLYRDETLYKTPEEAIVAHWHRHYSPNDRTLPRADK
jgi:hypothetical protein